MKRPVLIAGFLLAVSTGLTFTAFAKEKAVPPAPNGIEIPKDYKNWRLIAPSYRTDHGSIRAILGNDIAIEAARAGKTSPWPDGAVLAKIVWKERKDEHWEGAIVPGEFIHAEFMIKGAKKYEKTGGWGYARWLGTEQKPYGEDAEFVDECVACHTPVKSRDYVFTTPAIFPK